MIANVERRICHLRQRFFLVSFVYITRSYIAFVYDHIYLTFKSYIYLLEIYSVIVDAKKNSFMFLDSFLFFSRYQFISSKYKPNI